MARIESTMVPLGTRAPQFELVDCLTDQLISFSTIAGEKGTVVMFICNHCPFVLHTIAGIVSLAKEYRSKGIGFIAINSNDIEQYPADSPDNMKNFASSEGFTFPYVFDETQEVAHSYSAACTPDFFVFDHHHHLVYRGQLDDSRPGNDLPVNGHSLKSALECIIRNEEITLDQNQASDVI
ncbi:thioredoxin family protein [Bacillus coahuilensis]|uniref:thioredoxin family protein n=1 Tax=Bacillus coahuilensis TaxID=408580 RepID=UPI0001850DE1|nr:thioredoxin family protein [Bacillus coahuilensis]